MIDSRIAIAFTFVYTVALAVLLVLHNVGGFIVVAVIGGPITGLLYWLAAKRPQA